MKILQLNAFSLSRYKKILTGASSWEFEKKCPEQEISLSLDQIDLLRQYEKSTYLEPLEGTGVLLVQNDCGDLLHFLFDVPVCVKGGVWYAIIAYQCDLRYRFSGAQACESRELPRNTLTNGMPPQISITNIYSVLYQEKNLKSASRCFHHFYWELGYVDQGGLRCEVDGVHHTLRQGDLIFFTPHQRHQLYSTGKEPVAFFSISFAVNTAKLLGLGNRVFQSDSVTQRLLKEMLSEYNMDLLYCNEMIATKLLSLLIHIHRSTHGNFQHNESLCSTEAVSPCVMSAMRMIEESLPQKVSADDIAEKLYVSTSYLRRLFKEEMHLGISEYTRDRKLEKAKFMLLKGNYTIAQISDMLGYCSVCYFSTEFKKKYAVRPSDYKQSLSAAQKPSLSHSQMQPDLCASWPSVFP